MQLIFSFLNLVNSLEDLLRLELALFCCEKLTADRVLSYAMAQSIATFHIKLLHGTEEGKQCCQLIKPKQLS